MGRLERQYRDLSVPVTEFRFVVNLPEQGTRLDVALKAHYPWRSREHFQGMIDRGDVLLNDAKRKSSVRLRAGDVVRVKIPVAADAPARESDEGLVVLYEDDALVAIDKPSGVVAHPTGRIRHGTLINRLHARYRRMGPEGAAQGDVVPRLAHRIDKDTSGIVLVVKDRRLDAVVTRSFFRREVSKTYWALVRGLPLEDEGLVDQPLGPAPEAQTTLEMAVRADGQPSRTRWRVLERFRSHALLELFPLTGRTHQLRVHLRFLGHPIVADHLYGDLRPLRRSDLDPAIPPEADRILLDRLALHAHRLVLPHPTTGKPLALESPVPSDMRAAIDEARASMASAARASGRASSAPTSVRRGTRRQVEPRGRRRSVRAAS